MWVKWITSQHLIPQFLLSLSQIATTSLVKTKHCFLPNSNADSAIWWHVCLLAGAKIEGAQRSETSPYCGLASRWTGKIDLFLTPNPNRTELGTLQRVWISRWDVWYCFYSTTWRFYRVFLLVGPWRNSPMPATQYPRCSCLDKQSFSTKAFRPSTHLC